MKQRYSLVGDGELVESADGPWVRYDDIPNSWDDDYVASLVEEHSDYVSTEEDRQTLIRAAEVIRNTRNPSV